ncbi:hypothetical protein BDR04DRAFT_1130612 [Suillus decipiens]|nr:hypothetical protein BDR04DRAFT_1130612 [Suillus decipiens]
MAAEILVPTQEKNPNGNGQPFTIPGFRYWPLTAVIHATFSEATSKWFHFIPFKHFWRSPLKRVIAGLMFWSDSTHLVQFGNASAWLIYLYFGNQKSYHNILTHCKHEMFHVIWCILIDDNFLDEYRDGIIIKCHDRVTHQVFPRIFTYSADYPEKVLIAAICDKGVVARLYQSVKDTVIAARNAIYKLGAPIKGTAVECLLKEFSLVPTVFELGVFKSIFKHLIRLLYTINPEWIVVLNKW